MKTLNVIRTVTLSFLMTGMTAVYAQDDRLEVPGDHFSLEGALELFKKSASPEEFERLLNSPKSEVNNLDLNGDGDIDYIRVIDRNEGNVHAFILQAVISDREVQDVAVIELEKLANGKAVLQITGDEDIYGIETIIEPTEEVRVNAGTSTSRVYVNVWAWPSVQYIYSPYYYGWSSPWSWGYYPTWWSPWRPVAYYYYYPRWDPYRPYYSVCYTHRIGYAQRLYRPYRSTSVIVYNRHQNQITTYRSRSNDLNRGRDGSRQGNSADPGDRYDRQRSGNTWDGNSRSRSDNSRGNNEGNRGRSTTTREDSSLGNRSEDRTPSTWQRGGNGRQRQDSDRRLSIDNTQPRQRSEGNRGGSYSGGQRNSNNGVQRETRQPSYENRGGGSQRTPNIQPQRRESSGNSNAGRSAGSQGGGNSGGHKRGRD